jgi:uncharacterized protein (DUF1810 family)
VPDSDLNRFVTAQNGVFDQVLAELRACHKASHWMWFVFPQIAGLGHSEMARRYAIADAAEATAYLAHPVLGERLRTAVSLMLRCGSKSATDVLGRPDDLKFRSCLTLFAAVAVSSADRELLSSALQRFFDGGPDSQTLAILRRQRGAAP